MFIEGQIGHHLLETAVFLLQLLETTHLAGTQASL
jgi:hypothetical protein